MKNSFFQKTVFILFLLLPGVCLATVSHNRPMEWRAMTSGTTQTLNDVWGSSSSNIFAVGNNGTILHYDGTSWSQMSCPVTSNLTGIWGRSANAVYVVGDDSTKLFYNGSTWSAMGAIPHPAGSINDVSGTSSSTYLATFGPISGGTVGCGEVMKLSGGTSGNWVRAASFQCTGNKLLNAIYVQPSTDRAYAGGANTSEDHYPSAYVVTPAGNYSDLVASAGTKPIFEDMQAIMGIWGSGNMVFFMGVDYTIGQNDHTWVIKRLNTDALTYVNFPVGSLSGHAWDAWGPSESNAFFVGSNGKVVHFNGSSVFMDCLSDSSSDLHGVWGTGDSDVYAVGANGTILHFDNQPSEVTLTAPVNDSVQSATAVDFSWTAVPWADGYNLQISETQAMDQLVLNANVGTNTSYNVNGFENYGRPYFWRVTAYTNSGLQSASPVYRFDNGIAVAPILITPAHGSSIPGTAVRFAWHPFQDATKYYFQLATDAAFSNIVIQGNVENTEITLNGFPNDGTVYYWRVVHWDGSNVGPYWSRTNGFYNKAP